MVAPRRRLGRSLGHDQPCHDGGQRGRGGSTLVPSWRRGRRPCSSARLRFAPSTRTRCHQGRASGHPLVLCRSCAGWQKSCDLRLAELYASGTGVARDPVEAYALAVIAEAVLDDSDMFGVRLAELKAALGKELSPTQMKVARLRAQAMRPDLRRGIVLRSCSRRLRQSCRWFSCR